MSGVQANLNITVIRQRKQMRWETQDKGANQRRKPTGLATPHCKQISRDRRGGGAHPSCWEAAQRGGGQRASNTGAPAGGSPERVWSSGRHNQRRLACSWEGLLRYLEVRQSPPLRGSLLLSFFIHRAKPGGGGTQEGLRL